MPANPYPVPIPTTPSLNPTEVQEEGIQVVSDAVTFDFIGAGVTAAQDGGNPQKATVTIPGGAGFIVENEGSQVDPAAINVDFVGPGVTASQTSPGNVEVNVPGGTGGLTKRGTVAGDVDAGEGVYNLDSSAGAFDWTLPASGLGQTRRLFISQNLSNTVTFRVPAGENLNGVADATFPHSNIDDAIYVHEAGTGDWRVHRIPTNPGGTVEVEDEGSQILADVRSIDFIGAGVSVASTGADSVSVTIPSSAPASLDTWDEGGSVESGTTILNFLGVGVTAAAVGGGRVDITIPSQTPAAVETQNEGSPIEADTQSLNFTGAGVTATSLGGNAVEVSIPAQAPSAVAIEDEGGQIEANVSILNFIGPQITAASAGGGQVDVTISGSGSRKEGQDDLGTLGAGAQSVNLGTGSFDNKLIDAGGDIDFTVVAGAEGKATLTVTNGSGARSNLTWTMSPGPLVPGCELPPFVEDGGKIHIKLYWDGTNYTCDTDADLPNEFDGTTMPSTWVPDIRTLGYNIKITGQVPAGRAIGLPTNMKPGPAVTLDFDEAQANPPTPSTSFIFHTPNSQMDEPGSIIEIRQTESGRFHVWSGESITSSEATSLLSPVRKNDQDAVPSDTLSYNFDGDSYDNKVGTYTANATVTGMVATRGGLYGLTLKSDAASNRDITLPANVLNLAANPVSVPDTDGVALLFLYDGTNFHTIR